MLIKEAKNSAEDGDAEEAGDNAEEIEDDSEDSTANRVGQADYSRMKALQTEKPNTARVQGFETGQ